VHFLVAADRTATDIGQGVKANLDLLRSFEKAVQGSGLVVAEHAVLDPSFTCANIRKMVDEVQLQADDVLIFYYSGHGFRTPSSTTQYPEFDCAKAAPSEPTLGLAEVVGRMKQKTVPARLVIAIADSCNHLFTVPPVKVRGAPEVRYGARLKHVLGNFRGTMVAAAAKPKEDAYYATGDGAYGYFTLQFLRGIRDASSAEPTDTTWEGVRELVSQTIVIGPDYDPQEPVVQSDIKVAPH